MAEPKVARALLSVSDKTGLVDFAKGLAALGVELVSTGGTAKALREAGLRVRDVSELTGFPEMMDGRVKTLHPKVHGGILGRRDVHAQAAKDAGIVWIDLVVVNLYPFEATVAKPGVTREEAVENIDIGGPSMVRSAAKNADWVGIVTRPDQYAGVLEELKAHGGLTEVTRRRLSAEAFAATATYDAAIARHFSQDSDSVTGPRETMFALEDLAKIDDRDLRRHLNRVEKKDLMTALKTASDDLKKKFRKNMSERAWQMLTEEMDYMGPVSVSDVEAAQQRVLSAGLGVPPPSPMKTGGPLVLNLRHLRYGENPHQDGALHTPKEPIKGTVAGAKILGGKELSYNNLLDADAAWGLVNDLPTPAAAIIKHLTPCGAATATSLHDAFAKALAGDPVSAFGGILAVNVPLDAATAEATAAPGNFFEVVIAPKVTPEALEILTKKPKWGANVRILDAEGSRPEERLALRSISGGILVQTPDETMAPPRLQESPAAWTPATKRAMTPSESADADFAWAVCKHVKSNAIVLVKDCAVVGVGAGQMNRVNSVFLACRQAGEKAKGSALASDAFFPFRDGPDEAAKAGVTAIVQPGGSKKDAEVVAAADQHGMAMAFTGVRHFRH